MIFRVLQCHWAPLGLEVVLYNDNFLFTLSQEFLAITKFAKPKIKYHKFKDGSIVINADSTDPKTFEFIKKYLKDDKIQLFHSDPPYNIAIENLSWDKFDMNQQEFSDWMKSVIKLYYPLIHNRGSIYWWGGTGKKNNRPFFVFCSQIENDPDMTLTIANIITWKKKRFFGVKKNYGYAREECCYLVKSDENNPRVFNIPLTDKIRGYSGFGEYAAKSKFLRRTNIWDITEMFNSKIHQTEKPVSLIEIPIKASSNKGQWVLDVFGGSGSTGAAAMKWDRKFILVEKDPKYYNNIIKRLSKQENEKTDKTALLQMSQLQKLAHLFKQSTQELTPDYDDYTNWEASLSPEQKQQFETNIDYKRWGHKSNQELKTLILNRYRQELWYVLNTPDEQWPDETPAKIVDAKRAKAKRHFENGVPINLQVQHTGMGYQVIVDGEVVAMGNSEHGALVRAAAVFWS